MSETQRLHLEPTEEEGLLEAEFAVPRIEENLDEQAEAERDRYDEQILAALIYP